MRKKTMNLIILLFVILSSMFFASGVNNIFSIATGLDRYLDMAGLGDYIALVGETDGTSPMEDSLRGSDSVTGWRKERLITVIAENVKVNGAKMKGFSNTGMVLSPDKDIFRYFDSNNEIIEFVPDGKVYVTNSVAVRAGLHAGDEITIETDGASRSFVFDGVCKDAAMGSDMMDNPRFLISQNTFDEMMSDDETKIFAHSMYYIDSTDYSAVNKLITDTDAVRFSASRAELKTSYIVNMLIAGVIMAVSICLIVIAFVVLRFTIVFSITEEFREIGVMKAVGLKNRSIRALYLVKYLGLSVIGAAVGFAAAFPFGDLLMSSVSGNMIISNDHEILINALCCAAVILIILLFCWSCTASIKKLSPIDAVRSGQTGERFRKHGAIALSRSRLGANSFLSLNDVMSSPKQTALLTAVFTLSALLVMILSNTAATLSGDGLIYLLGVTESDIYFVDYEPVSEIIGGKKTIAETNEDVRRTLEENGLYATVHNEARISALLKHGDATSSATFMWCADTDSEDYYYNEGSAPRYSDEIAVTYDVAKDLGAGIGDTVEVNLNGSTGEYVITALYDSFNGLGRCGKFHESFSFPETSVSTLMAFQIDFDDAPDDAVINERIAKMKDIFGSETIYDKAGFVNDCTKAADTVTGVKNLTLIVSLIIMILITVLIERSFIAKERAEIALLKALGFRSGSVIHIHILRFVIISAISLAAAALLSIPATKLTMDPIFAMMGASSGMTYNIDIRETFLIFPVLIFASVTAGAFFTSLYTKTVKASDTADIE